MAVKEFKLPDVGEGVAEGELVRWFVEPGDTVTEDQTVAEVETDKALVEVPSPYDGTVKELRAEAGEVVPVGTVIITFEVDGADDATGEDDAADEEAAAADAEGAAAAEAAEDAGTTAADAADAEPAGAGNGGGGGRTFAPPSVRRLARELGVDLGAVDGSGPGGRVTEGDVRTVAEGGDATGGDATGGDDAGAADDAGAGPRDVDVGGQSAVSQRADDGEPSAAPAGDVAAAGRERTLAAPATRRVAKEEGVDIDDVPAVEERDGEAFVTAEAVREYAEAQRRAQAADAAAVSASAEPAAEPTTEPSAGDGEAAASAEEPAEADVGPKAGETVPYTGVRRTIGKAMENSKYTAPHVTHHDTVVVDELVELREEFKPMAEERGVKLTYMPFVMKACVAALKQHPYVNAQLDEEAEEIRLMDDYHVGVATATDAGLMVPVVEDVDRRGILDISRRTNEVVGKARDRSISLSELRGSTFTITNVGVIGGEYATPIINHPEVAILALGAIEQRPVVEDGEVVARYTLPLSLSIDHRVIDGAAAAQFTNTVMEYLRNPKLLMLE